ncbi:c-type cytochrome [Sulfurospirillum sp. hDNRA2]|uniref:c-type cytochrome n=1 Tax=Sulfurospirillum sp. hDNRA2 TaxID=3237298 RepID=UPI0020B81C52|nr:c-type cytochrome [Sulfurospirillum sp. DNRA8]MCP3652423.1 c-type cytochrome [Sulfurospirillum sp. DNRA8]MCR1811274.1 c-type cytochrome [Sulfurospirillum sp. DNRA8]
MKKVLVLASILCATSIFAADGATLYKTCATCHGAKAEKAALNKSQIIAGWSADKIAAALNGYKAGTYGGPLKATMAGQVKNLDADAITSLSKYIEGLK